MYYGCWCSDCVFGAHLAFTINAEPDILPILLASKLIGGFLGLAISMFVTRDMKNKVVSGDGTV